MAGSSGTALSSILVGDIVTPHEPGERFEYVASVVIVDGTLRQACLPDVLGGYPKDPGAVSLTAEQRAALAEASDAATDLATLLAWAEEDTLMLARGFGASNLRRYVANHEPALLDNPALQVDPSAEGGGKASLVLVLLVALAVLALLGLGAWVAVRVVSGF